MIFEAISSFYLKKQPIKKISAFNGKVEVVSILGFGKSIRVGGLTQSGGVVETVWRQTLREVKKQNKNVRNCLILGLGGGSAAKIVNNNWLDCIIVGVEIDPLMIALGIKYLDLTKTKVDIVNQDGLDYLKSKKEKKNNKYDLILIDIYIGDTVPTKFETLSFLTLIGERLRSNGVAVFNRLYYGSKRTQAVKFGNKLESVFRKVNYFYPEANLMLLCQK